MKLVSADFRGLDDHLRNMDRSGVGLQLLSVSGQLPYFRKGKRRGGCGAAGQRYLCAHRARISEALRGLRLHSAAACATRRSTETRRALDELGMVGVTTGTVVLGKSITDPAFDEFFAELNRRKAVLFIHPTGGALGSQLIESTKLVWPVGAPLEDTVCLLQFMQANFPVAFSGH